MSVDFKKGLCAVLLDELHNYESAQKLCVRLSEFSGLFVELIDFGGCGLSGRSELPGAVTPGGYRAAKKQMIQQLFADIYDRRMKTGAVDGYISTAKLISWDGIPVAVGIVLYPSQERDGDAAALLLQMENFCRYVYTGDLSLKPEDAGSSDVLSHLLFDTDPDIAALVSALLPSYKRHALVSAPYIALNFQADEKNSAVSLKAAYDRFGADRPDSYRIVRKNEFLAILCNFDVSAPEAVQKKWEHLNAFCEKYSLRCGCSMVFSDIAERETYIKQARAVNCLGAALGRGQRLFRTELLLPELMAETAARNDPQGSLILSELLALHKYDAENSSEYLRTLEVYLTNGRSMTDTASVLFIDRSTLKYRLNKIQDMTCIDFSDDARCSALLMGCLVYRSHMRRAGL